MSPPNDNRSDAPNPAVAGVLAWLIPGAGHFYIGCPGRTVLFFVGVIGLMMFGSALGQWQVVVSSDRVWFLVHAGAGIVSLWFAAMNRGMEAVVGTSPLIEIGHLYTRVAGMLNLLLVLDAYSRAEAMAAAPMQPMVVSTQAAPPPVAPVNPIEPAPVEPKTNGAGS